jgi:CRISPR type III-associated protein (TIGR04423 family)
MKIRNHRLDRQELAQLWQEFSGDGWEGYIWLSDASQPTFVDWGALPTWSAMHRNDMIFIHEAWLWHEVKERSVHVRQLDDLFSVRIVDFHGDARRDFSHLTRVLPGVTRMHFYQHWYDVPDLFEAGFIAREPGWTALVGLERS